MNPFRSPLRIAALSAALLLPAICMLVALKSAGSPIWEPPVAPPVVQEVISHG